MHFRARRAQVLLDACQVYLFVCGVLASALPVGFPSRDGLVTTLAALVIPALALGLVRVFGATHAAASADGDVSRLLRLLRSSDAASSGMAVGALTQLAGLNDPCARSVLRAGAVPALLAQLAVQVRARTRGLSDVHSWPLRFAFPLALVRAHAGRGGEGMRARVRAHCQCAPSTRAPRRAITDLRTAASRFSLPVYTPRRTARSRRSPRAC